MDNKQATLELGTKPVGRLLCQYAFPAIIAMTASSLYNMIDSIFIGQGVGAEAIAGLAITFPFMNLLSAFGAAIGVGASTFISVRLGQKDYATAQNILGNNATLNVLIGIVLTFVGLIFLDPILRFFGASDQTLPYARDYMEIILLFNTVTHLYFGMNAVLRAAGKPRQAMMATIFTVILNIALAPLFIWGAGWGIRGAALATVLAQTLAMFWELYMFSNKHELLHFCRGIFKLRSSLVKNIVGIGISPFSMNACACIVVIFINHGMVSYGGDMAVGAYGISNRIAFVFVMIVIGINQGMQPIAGYNYGAQKFDRFFRVLKYAVYAATATMVVAWGVAQFFPYQCARLFTTDAELIRLSIDGIRINMLVFPIIGYQMVITNFFQSIGKAKISIFLSLSRQMIFLLPAVIILPLFFGLDGVWYALPVSDFIAAVVTALVMWLFMRKIKAERQAGGTASEL